MKRLATLLLGALLTLSAKAAIIPPGGGGLAWLTVSNLSYNIAVNIAGTGGISSATATNIANAAINNARTNLLPFINVTNWGVLNDGNDIGPALQALMEVHKERGGVMFFPDGTNYQLDSYLYIPTNTGVVPPQQAHFFWLGSGAKKKGQSVGSFGGTRINMGFTNGPFKIFSGGLGIWQVEGIDFQIKAGREANKAVLATFTSLVWDNWSHGGATSGSNAIADFIQFGGVGPPNFTDWSTNASAQGYGTDMGRWYVDKTRSVFTLNDHANDYNLGHGFFGHGSGGHKAIVLQTNGWGSLLGVMIPHVAFEGPSFTNLLYIDGADNTHANVSAYDPLIPCTVVIFTNGAVGNYVREIFIDPGFTDYNDIAGNTFATSHAGKTNRQNNAQRYATTVRFDASVPFQLPHSDGSYSYPAVNDNGLTWYHTTIGGVDRVQFRAIDISATETTFALGGSATAILHGAGELIFDGNPPIFKVNGTEKARLNATGFGIGTNNPQTTLHVHGGVTLNNVGTNGSPVSLAGFDANGTLQETAIPTGSGTPGGSSLQVQYNTNSTFAGDAGLTYDPVTDALTAGSFLATGSTTDGHIAFTNLTGFWTAFAPTNAARSHTNVWETWPIEPTQVFVPVGTNGGRVHWKGTVLKVSLAGAVTGATSVESGIFTQDTGTGTFQLGGGSVNLVSITKALSVGHAITSVAGVGGALTNFTLLAGAGAAAEEIYIDAGTTNVNIVAIMGYASDAVHYINVTATNRTGTSRLLSFGAETNAFVSLQQFDGITAPFTVTNSQALNLYLKVGPGTNVQYAAKPSALPAP